MLPSPNCMHGTVFDLYLIHLLLHIPIFQQPTLFLKKECSFSSKESMWK